MQPFFAQESGNCRISLLLPRLEWPGHRPLKLVWTQNGLCRQMKLRCQCHTGCLTSRPRQMKLRWRTHPSFGPSLRLLGLHLNPHPSAVITYFDTNYSRSADFVPMSPKDNKVKAKAKAPSCHPPNLAGFAERFVLVVERFFP